MPETPDFEQIARALDAELDDSPAGLGGRFLGARLTIIVEQLRQIWNARGAADIATLEVEIPQIWTSAEPADALTRALRGLDR